MEAKRIDVALTPGEYDALLVLCGYAVGSAMARGETKIAIQFLEVVNKLFAANKDFRPYNLEGIKTEFQRRAAAQEGAKP